jgi:hypothetical protein
LEDGGAVSFGLLASNVLTFNVSMVSCSGDETFYRVVEKLIEDKCKDFVKFPLSHFTLKVESFKECPKQGR